MKIAFTAILISFLSSCHFSVELTKDYEQYFDEETYQIFQKGIEAYLQDNNKLADSLFTIVINNSQEKLSIAMPQEFNPYFYRGSNCLELDKYEQAISDFENVAKDTTTNTDVLIVRAEAFKMLKQYDTAISICNKLLILKYDSLGILSQRGVCFYLKGEIDKACNDLNYSKELGGDTSYLNIFLKDCK